MTRKKHRASHSPTLSATGQSQLDISLTSQAELALAAIAKETGLSKSDLLEGILGGSIAISSQGAERTVNLKITEDSSEETRDRPVSTIEVTTEGQTITPPEPKEVTLGDTIELQETIERQQQQIEGLERQIARQEDLVAEKININESLTGEIEVKNSRIKALESEIGEAIKYKEQASLAAQLKDKIAQQEQDYQSLKTEFATKNNQIKQLEGQLESLNQEKSKFASLQETLQDREKSISELNSNLNSLEQQLVQKQELAESLQQALSQKEGHLSQLKEQLSSLEQKLAQKQELAESLQQALSQKESYLSQLKEQSSSLEQKLAQKQELAESLQQALSQKEGHLSQLEQQLAQKDSQVNLLAEKLTRKSHELEDFTQELNRARQSIFALQSLANIGERMLGKWRLKSY